MIALILQTQTTFLVSKYGQIKSGLRKLHVIFGGWGNRMRVFTFTIVNSVCVIRILNILLQEIACYCQYCTQKCNINSDYIMCVMSIRETTENQLCVVFWWPFVKMAAILTRHMSMCVQQYSTT